jgi:nucleoside-diphosphate-sugar epimerase
VTELESLTQLKDRKMTGTDSQTEQSAQLKCRVAITGAGGLVGSYLVQFLLRKGYSVICILRKPDKPKHLADFIEAGKGFDPANLTIRIADVNDLISMRKAFEGAEVVVHAAGNVDPYGLRAEIFRTNVEGSRLSFQAANAQGVRQFIHVSSLSVITGRGDQYQVDESAPLVYCGENYADSKVLAEETLTLESKSSSTALTIMRPGFIYGPHEKSWLPRLIDSIRCGKAALIDKGTKETNVIYVENLSRAIEKAILKKAAFGQKYNLTDGQNVTKKMLFDKIADELGLPRVQRVIPSFVAKPFFKLVSAIAPLLSVPAQRSLARYSQAAFRLVGLNQGFSIAKAEKELNYTDRVAFTEGMAATLKEFKLAKTM